MEYQLVSSSPMTTTQAPLADCPTPCRRICKQLGVERATPHDLRRTHGTMITGLGFGRDAMNRIQNHKEGGIADVYDQHEYADENKRIMEVVAVRILALATSKVEQSNILELYARI